jgi:cobalt-zinc-cadmium efflux system outer membrane protein
MTRAQSLFLSASLCLAAGSGFGQTPAIPQRLSLEEAVQLTIARNPQAAAARIQVEVAEAGQLEAELRPNPAVSLESEGYPLFESPLPYFLDNQELTVRFDQELETAGRRGLRKESAATALDAARLTLRDRLRVLALAVQRAYFRLVLAQADRDVAGTSLNEIDRVLSLSRERARVGEIAGADVRRLEVERLRFADDVFSAELALKNSRSALLALLGAEDLSQPVEAIDALAMPDASAAPVPTASGAPPIETSALATRPDLLAARAEAGRAETETRLQRALRSPNVTLGGGYRRDFGTNAVVFGVTVPLPLWNKNQGAVARAEAERRLAMHSLAAIELDVRLDIQQAVNTVETARERAEYIESQVLASARESRDVVSQSYQLGAVDLIDFLDAQRAFRDTLRAHNRALFEYHVGLFELEAAVGISSMEP